MLIAVTAVYLCVAVTAVYLCVGGQLCTCVWVDSCVYLCVDSFDSCMYLCVDSCDSCVPVCG